MQGTGRGKRLLGGGGGRWKTGKLTYRGNKGDTHVW